MIRRLVRADPARPDRICGTGRLALGMAAAGHTVTGMDPARASLEAARVKPGASHVTWIEGTSGALPDRSFDVVVMTSHVAQFFVSDDEWRLTLADLKRALVPRGRLAFDTRDPLARGWERWNPAESRRRVILPDGRVVTVWTEVTAVRDGAVSSAIHNACPCSSGTVTTHQSPSRSQRAAGRLAAVLPQRHTACVAVLRGRRHAGR